jgi:hypothetical protein
VSSLLSVSLFKFITWDRAQLVGLGIPLRFIAKPSYAGHCASTHVVHKAAKRAPGTMTFSFYLVLSTGQFERKNKFGPRAAVITRGQTVPVDRFASRGRHAG